MRQVPIKEVSNPLRPFEKITIKDQCPHCGSVFVTKRECEACGKQFWIDLLGEPFGVRSFFTLKDDFELEQSMLLRYLPLSFFGENKKIKKYRRALLKRYEILCGYFFEETESDRKKRKLFLFECKELTTEMIKLGEDPSLLWKISEFGDGHILYPKIISMIKDSERNKPVSIKSQIKLTWKNYSIYGVISLSFIVKFLLGAVVISLCSFLVMKYLLLTI